MTRKIKRIISAFAIFVVCCCCFSTTAHAKTDFKTGVAIVKGSSLRLRENHSLSARVLDYAEKGDYVVVSGKVGNWYKVNYNLQTGYMHENYLSFIGKENIELGYGSVSGSNVNMRTGPSTQYSPIKRLQNNDLVYIIGINNGWYKVISENSIGYMRSDYVELTEIPYENADSNNEPLFFEKGKWMCNSIDTSLIKNKNDVAVESDVNKDENVLVSKNDIIILAEQNLGVPYVYGGSSPSGFDCSGLVYYVFKNLGYSLPRTARAQYYAGTPIAKSDIQPGDLVFFQNTSGNGISHVGIYTGNGQFIHAPSTGKVVSYANLNSSYYTSHYFGACRLSK